jgi:hypothetical protein
MVEGLQIFSWFFHAVFATVSLFVWDANTIWAYTDAVFCLICPFANYFWYLMYEADGRLKPPQITLFCMLMGYMTMRLWMWAIQPCHKSWKGHVEQKGGSSELYCLDVVWMTFCISSVKDST